MENADGTDQSDCSGLAREIPVHPGGPVVPQIGGVADDGDFFAAANLIVSTRNHPFQPDRN